MYKRQVPDSINWGASDVSKYRYVQSAGSSNALGLVKFIFPNDFSVFLHDTNSRSLFKKNYRARSSGCVRVHKPFDLSEKLLNDQERWSREKIDTVVKKRKTQRVHLTKDVQVHILYWSVVFNEKNKVNFVNDVYQFDKKLAKVLTQ